MKKRLLSLIGATLLFSSSISPAYAAGSYLSNEPKQSVAIVASSGADSEIIPYMVQLSLLNLRTKAKCPPPL